MGPVVNESVRQWMNESLLDARNNTGKLATSRGSVSSYFAPKPIPAELRNLVGRTINPHLTERRRNVHKVHVMLYPHTMNPRHGFARKCVVHPYFHFTYASVGIH